MTTTDRFDKQRIADGLEEPVEEAKHLARKLGLDPTPVNYWIVDYGEMNELIAYDGFQHRYPHWRWGMKYDRQRKKDRYGGGKVFEIVNNDNPAHAFLQESNDVADQKAVVTHVEAHSDFFANNEWYGMFTDRRDAASMLERHAKAIHDIMADPEVDRSAVEKWIDHALTLEDNIDQHQSYSADYLQDETTPGDADELDDDVADQLSELDLSEEVQRQVFDEEWLDRQDDDDERATFPEDPEKDLLAFLRAHGKAYDEGSDKAVEMEPWQQDVLDMLRAEAYYFAPQKMTKVMNEGWACVAPDTRVFTAEGLVPMGELVESQVAVSDGETERDVYDSNVISDHDTVTIETRRGFELTGSNNHRVRTPDDEWVRLDEIEPGQQIAISGGDGIWPNESPRVDWDPDQYTSLEDVAEEAGVSVWTVMRYREVGRAEKADAIESALSRYDEDANPGHSNRQPIRVPDTVTEKLGRFLGLLIGDGHVPENSRHIGFTSGVQAHAEEFAGLVSELFGVESTVEQQGTRWRVYAYSKDLRDLLTEYFGLPTGQAADRKTIPGPVLRSPKSVVAEFLRGLFDADGYAGDQGAILSTKSEEMAKTVQLTLTNFEILSRRREQHTDGCQHVHLTGESARRFDEEIGFGYAEKDEQLSAYLDGLAWFETESWTDEVTAVETGTGDVYDISVRDTHRYAAAGFVNHNSYWESTMMADERFAGADEFLNYADHMAAVLGAPGLNPYKLGNQLWNYVENTTNRREVVERLLRVEGITWQNFADAVDVDAVLSHLEPSAALQTITSDTLDEVADLPDEYLDAENLERARDGDIDVEAYPWKVLTYEGLARRNYSLVQPENRGYLGSIGDAELEQIGRYVFETDRYDDVKTALADVDYTAGWDTMFELRESHNDVTFLDRFLTEEFVENNDYFTYEFSRATGQNRVASTDYQDVKQKLLLQFTNFGKPTIAVYDGNYGNRNELLLGHQYNGIALDVPQAKRVLERVFELWGRPVNLMTIVKEVDDHDLEVAKRRGREPEPDEQGRLLRYDGDSFSEEDLPWEEVEHLAADDVDYDTRPEDWLA